MVEIWKDIQNYEGMYQVSNLGRIKSLSRYDALGRHVNEKILTPIEKPKKQYLIIGLKKDGKREWFHIHRLVGIHFIPNQLKLPEINHKDWDRKNNNVCNLEWCTREYNCKHQRMRRGTGGRRNRKIEQLELDGTVIQSFDSIKAAGEYLGKLGTNIGDCVRGKQKTAHGYMWRYKEKVCQ